MVNFSKVACRVFLGIVGTIVLASSSVFAADGDVSSVLEQAASSFQGAPPFIAFGSYIAAIIIMVMGLMKLKEVADKPDEVSVREPFARFAIAGALTALPTMVNATMLLFYGGGGDVGVTALTMWNSADLGGILLGDSPCDGDRYLEYMNAFFSQGFWGGVEQYLLGGGTLGQSICYAAHSFSSLPGVLSMMFYITGVFLMVWAIMQMRDYMLKPDQAPISAPLKKLAVAGAFMTFPYVITVVRNSFSGDGALLAGDPFINASCGSGATGDLMELLRLLFGDEATDSSGGLDCMMVKLVSELFWAVPMAVSIFSYIAGLILIALAVRRMMDNMDKGAKSPVGMGTLAMFAIGGMLLSIDTIIKAITVSIFPDFYSDVGLASLKLRGELSYAPGVGEDAMKSVNTIITTVFAFSFLVGIISLVRGLFILKEVANGGNASLMAGFTHIIGGGLAINLGPTIQGVQNTLGLGSVGIQVSM